MKQKTIKSKKVVDEFPKIIETFKKMGDYEFRGLKHDEPSCINGWVRVERYRITVEKIEEPVEIIHERLEKLWVESDNWHHRDPLVQKAKEFNYTFKGEFGSQRPNKGKQSM